MKTLKLELLYRDAHLWKTQFSHDVDLNKYPNALDLKEGHQIKMGQYGTLYRDHFFGSEIHIDKYYEQFDHNILTVVSVEVSYIKHFTVIQSEE